MTDQDDVPLLEEVVFPDNEMDEALTGDGGVSQSEGLDIDQYKSKLLEAIDQQLDEVIEKAIYRTLQDSIAILAEEMKDEVKTQIQQEIEKIVTATLKA